MRDAATAHALTVWLRPSSGIKHGECVCGWEGPRRMSRERVETDWLAHAEADEVVLRPKDVKP